MSLLLIREVRWQDGLTHPDTGILLSCGSEGGSPEALAMWSWGWGWGSCLAMWGHSCAQWGLSGRG